MRAHEGKQLAHAIADIRRVRVREGRQLAHAIADMQHEHANASGQRRSEVFHVSFWPKPHPLQNHRLIVRLDGDSLILQHRHLIRYPRVDRAPN